MRRLVFVDRCSASRTFLRRDATGVVSLCQTILRRLFPGLHLLPVPRLFVERLRQLALEQNPLIEEFVTVFHHGPFVLAELPLLGALEIGQERTGHARRAHEHMALPVDDDQLHARLVDDVALLDAVSLGTPFTATGSPLSSKIGVRTDIRDGYSDWELHHPV